MLTKTIEDHIVNLEDILDFRTIEDLLVVVVGECSVESVYINDNGHKCDERKEKPHGSVDDHEGIVTRPN